MTSVPGNVSIEDGQWVEITWPLDPAIEPAVDEVVDPDDWAPAPEFSAFKVWCSQLEDWAVEWRPSPNDPWQCRNCGSADHRRQDQEEV